MGEDEFDARGGTIPQRLLLMNGEVVREQIKDDFFTAASQIAGLAPDDTKAVEAAYLAVLTRRPLRRGIGPLRRPARGDSGDERKRSAHRPLLDPAQLDGILVEPLRPS